MPETWAGELGEFRAISTAAGGTALSTTPAFVTFPALALPGDRKQGHLFIYPRNFTTGVVAQILFNPWLTVLKTTDNMATLPLDYSIEAQDGSAATDVVLSSLDTVANGDWLLVGSHIPIGGASVDVDATNSTGSVTLTIASWTGSWVNDSLTYSTAWTTAFDADTRITWTPNPNWAKITFRKLYPNLTATAYYSDIPLYWTRWSVNAAMDASVTLDSLLAMNRSGAYGELASAQELKQRTAYGFCRWGCIQAVINAGTGNLIVNLATLKDEGF